MTDSASAQPPGAWGGTGARKAHGVRKAHGAWVAAVCDAAEARGAQRGKAGTEGRGVQAMERVPVGSVERVAPR